MARLAPLCLAAILATLGFSALAAAPEEAYWTERAQAIARLAALADAKAKPEKIRKVEDAALEKLQRRVIAMVGVVGVEGYSDLPKSHVTALGENPEFGLLDGVSFAALGDAGGELVVTTEALLRMWLREGSNAHPEWKRAGFAALRSDAFLGDALDIEDGFLGVVDLGLAPPPGAIFAAAELGRWGPHVDSIPRPVLIVTVVAGRRVFIAVSRPATKIDDIPACRRQAGDPAEADAFGPFEGPEFEAWRNCERRNFAGAPFHADLLREARRITDRLAHAN
jgi:hypothetical protein